MPSNTLSDDQISDFRDCFMLFDRVGDSKIEAIHIGDCVRALGLNPTVADVNRVSNFKENPHKRFTFEEFIPMYLDLAEKKDALKSMSEFYEGFRVFDKEGQGRISRIDLKHLLTKLGERLQDDEADLILQGMDDSEGMIKIDELLNVIINNNN